MPKKKTSKKRKFCIDDIPISGKNKKHKAMKSNPEKAFKNQREVGIALLQYLEDNDPESFVEILDVYLQVNRSEIARKTNLSRQTVKNTLSGRGNPTLRTLAQIVHEAVV